MALTYPQLQQHLQELYHFLQAVHTLGRESPQAYAPAFYTARPRARRLAMRHRRQRTANVARSLLYLAEVVQPDLPANARIPTLGHMFEELPAFFNGAPHHPTRPPASYLLHRSKFFRLPRR